MSHGKPSKRPTAAAHRATPVPQQTGSEQEAGRDRPQHVASEGPRATTVNATERQSLCGNCWGPSCPRLTRRQIGSRPDRRRIDVGSTSDRRRIDVGSTLLSASRGPASEVALLSSAASAHIRAQTTTLERDRQTTTAGACGEPVTAQAANRPASKSLAWWRSPPTSSPSSSCGPPNPHQRSGRGAASRSRGTGPSVSRGPWPASRSTS